MIVAAAPGIWCDYCKSRWGKVKGQWHEKAKCPAVVTCISERFAPRIRSYCRSCMVVIEGTFDGTRYTLPEQMAAGLTFRSEKEINV